MARRIVTVQYQAVGAPRIDTYFDKVVKLIPADIVGAWVAVSGMVREATDVPKDTLLWVCFCLGLILTFVWTLKQTAEPGKKLAYIQALISTGAFFVWVFALVGGAFEFLSFYRHLYGSLALIFYTLLVPLIYPPEQ